MAGGFARKSLMLSARPARLESFDRQVSLRREDESNESFVDQGRWPDSRGSVGDEASRIAFTMIMPDEKATSAIAFLKAAVAYYKSVGVSVARVMTDNGSCYKSFAFAHLPRT